MKLLISRSEACNVKTIKLKMQNFLNYNVPQIYSENM